MIKSLQKILEGI